MRKKIKIKTTLPVNISSSLITIFKRRQFYKIPILKTKKINNVFLTHYGIILKDFLPIKYTLPNAFGYRKPNAGFFISFYKKGLEINLVCSYGKSLRYIQLDEKKTYLFIYSPWFGYFSWITESIPRILSVIKDHNNLTLIIPESYSKKKFVVESLKMFPQLKHEIIEEGIHMKIPEVVIPELKPFIMYLT